MKELKEKYAKTAVPWWGECYNRSQDGQPRKTRFKGKLNYNLNHCYININWFGTTTVSTSRNNYWQWLDWGEKCLKGKNTRPWQLHLQKATGRIVLVIFIETITSVTQTQVIAPSWKMPLGDGRDRNGYTRLQGILQNYGSLSWSCEWFQLWMLS